MVVERNEDGYDKDAGHTKKVTANEHLELLQLSPASSCTGVAKTQTYS
jgi:hypothetical protein